MVDVLIESTKSFEKDLSRLSENEKTATIKEINDCASLRTRKFPKTRLHKIKGIKQAIYRADVDKISGWRLYIQYINGYHLKDIIEGQRHDDVIEVIKSKKLRYE